MTARNARPVGVAGADAAGRSPFPASPSVKEPDGLVVFDGHCNFCSAQVQAILRADRAGTVRFTAIQSPYGRHLARRFGVAVDDPSTFLFFDDGQALTQSEAAIALARRLPRPFRWLGAIAVLPRPLRDAAYRLVAKNRYRIAGRRETCMVPSAQERSRFIDEVPPGEA